MMVLGQKTLAVLYLKQRDPLQPARGEAVRQVAERVKRKMERVVERARLLHLSIVKLLLLGLVARRGRQ